MPWRRRRLSAISIPTRSHSAPSSLISNPPTPRASSASATSSATGPHPSKASTSSLRSCEWSLLGNHDFAVLYEPTNFNPGAEAAAYWTREQFDAEPDEEARRRRYEFLGRLRVRVVEDDRPFPLLAVHGSPRKPINEYIFPDDAINSYEKMRQIFDRVDRTAVVGHTHVPGVFTDETDFDPPDELGNFTYTFSEDEKAIINVGSVGQPRDQDPRASYVLLHEDRVEFRRVEYDIEATAKLIYDIPKLNDWLADRLFDGR